MPRPLHFLLSLILVAPLIAAAQEAPKSSPPPSPGPITIRVATFNLEDVRTTDLKDGAQPRLRALAEVIQRLRPNIILLNEIAYDSAATPSAPSTPSGQNAQRFLDLYLHHPQLEGAPAPIRYRVFVAPSNTGLASGFDLNNDGAITTTFPTPPPSDELGSPSPQTADGRAFGEDAWGFGTFPGQYAMALLVDERLEILTTRARTFQKLPWDYMPGAYLPTFPVTPVTPAAAVPTPSPDSTNASPSAPSAAPAPQTPAPITSPVVLPPGPPWYSDEERALMRLSSKSHWDVPVRLPNGAVLHLLASHPTPPAFDGPELRNKKRNYDEIRFWADYINQQSWIVDDANVAGGLIDFASFIILGDLNADPDEGSSFKDPIGRLLRPLRRLNMDVVPTSDIQVPGLDPDDTAMFRLRVDYVLPSADLDVKASGVWRQPPTLAPKPGTFPSDHFPVWIDISVPAPGGR